MNRPLLLILVLLAGCGKAASNGKAVAPETAPPRPATIMLDWTINSDHGGLYTAIQRGYFARNHIAAAPKVPSSSTSQIQLVAAGQANFGISYETDLLAARAQHIPVRSVMCIMQHPLNTVMALKSSGITRPRQLAGKTIGMAGSPSDIPIVSAVMRHDGASIKEARMVNVGYNLLPALLSRRVDAVVGVYWTWEAIQARMKGYPVNVMRVERWGVPNYCELVLVASERTIRAQPIFVREVVQSLQQGYADAAAHPLAAWTALHRADAALSRPLVLRSLELLGPVETDATTVGYQDPRQWEAYAAWLWANHMISRPVAADVAYTNQFLQPHVR
ncbi:MAG TPA: ABC transporter substrate-binding protein [Chloroflexota bacterium]|nr:ABC transporter substrate-binding protein [Chloroflexota bacterium]